MDNDMIVSLSFSSYSTGGLATIAVKITNEFNDATTGNNSDGFDDGDDFEFSLVLDDRAQIYPKMWGNEDFSVKVPLNTLFSYDSSSSSEVADELQTSSYCCLWRPKKKVVESNKRKKCNDSSTNGERRHRKSRGWNKLFDLLSRSNSGAGERAFVYLNSDHRKMKAAAASSPVNFLGSPMEAFYVRNKAENEGSKRKSFLPYRQQLVGFFSATTKLNGI